MHHGGLDQAMATAAEIEPTCAALCAYLREQMYWGDVVEPLEQQFIVELYAGALDPRIGWKQTYAIKMHLGDNRWYIVGWTDEPLKD